MIVELFSKGCMCVHGESMIATIATIPAYPNTSMQLSIAYPHNPCASLNVSVTAGLWCTSFSSIINHCVTPGSWPSCRSPPVRWDVCTLFASCYNCWHISGCTESSILGVSWWYDMVGASHDFLFCEWEMFLGCFVNLSKRTDSRHTPESNRSTFDKSQIGGGNRQFGKNN